jgi:hypothetical protein
MENDVRTLVEKLKGSVAELTALRCSKQNMPSYLGQLDELILRAEAKVQTTEVTLMSLVRSTFVAGRR